ncbi:cytokinin dehydrogenase 5 isoform X2 [Hevea brasiliensis]|uniref:cytokinin dehydrogenase 5 isoform X2 n=1 Tax=Hevea brasiliensis TaxID=3981 RepID=UPI0025D83778|nr:cytokinin dehydrogenase 5 isoform X2 [Hevea brasiliensis]
MAINKFLLTFAICRLIATVGLTVDPAELLRLGVDGQLSVDPSDVEIASLDFGLLSRAKPIAVLRPASAEDVALLVRAAYNSAGGFTVSARGHGHSINGQAQISNGVVIEMSSRSRAGHQLGSANNNPAPPQVSVKEMHVHVWGGELWIDVLRSTLEHGLAPKSWTDYLYLSVGGTLSNAGISGQAFNHGPQISNVHELDVVTGKGEILTCSEEENSELFHAVLGGLGQFGIITRARISLEPAPQREVESLLKKLNFIPSSVFTTDLPYVDFLDRVHKAELKLRSKGLWDVPHPWLNLFVPKSRIADFDKGVFKGILGNKTSGPILIYPMNRNKWDQRSSVVTPVEDVFYLVAFLRSALDDGEETHTLEYLSNQNRQILRFCDDAGIKVKQYLPHYTTQQEWVDHFGDKWSQFYQNKMEFDPRRILATGQRIFMPSFVAASSSSSSFSTVGPW